MTYEIETNPPSAMDWEKYKSNLMVRWKDLLDSEASNIEKNIQQFLEENPCLIPGPFGITFSSGHFPFPSAVITQPLLKGLATKIPDFMWIASDSGTIYPILIEIETPKKRWFTKEGITHSDFTQAHAQLTSWKTWFNSAANQQLFLEYYKVPGELYQTRRIHPLYVLIYGSRREFISAPGLNAMRSHLQGIDETLMTFDRLAPEEKAQDMLGARFVESASNRYYDALTVPPTLKLGPLCANDRARILNKEEAVQKNGLISPERKQFLLGRIPMGP